MWCPSYQLLKYDLVRLREYTYTCSRHTKIFVHIECHWSFGKKFFSWPLIGKCYITTLIIKNEPKISPIKNIHQLQLKKQLFSHQNVQAMMSDKFLLSYSKCLILFREPGKSSIKIIHASVVVTLASLSFAKSFIFLPREPQFRSNDLCDLLDIFQGCVLKVDLLVWLEVLFN